MFVQEKWSWNVRDEHGHWDHKAQEDDEPPERKEGALDGVGVLVQRSNVGVLLAKRVDPEPIANSETQGDKDETRGYLRKQNIGVGEDARH